jgi:hypothetical protein
LKVKAINKGIYPSGTRRRVGERFNWDDKDWERLKGLKKLPSWVVPETEAGKAAAPEKPGGNKGPKSGTKAPEKPGGADKAPAAENTGGAPALPGT